MAADFFLGESLVGDGNEVAHIDLIIGSKSGPAGAAFANALANNKDGFTTLLAVVAPNLPCKPDTVLFNKVTIKGAKQAVQMFGPAQAAVARAVVDSVANGIIDKSKADDLVHRRGRVHPLGSGRRHEDLRLQLQGDDGVDRARARQEADRGRSARRRQDGQAPVQPEVSLRPALRPGKHCRPAGWRVRLSAGRCRLSSPESSVKKLLLQLDTSPLPSVFDRVVALDGGADDVMSYGGVTPETVRDLVHGAIFTRGPKDLHHTAIFVGGTDMAAGERLFAAARKAFFGPMRVSVMLDSNGSNTTAVAAVAKVVQAAGGDVKGTRAVVTAGTGPVGMRAAGLLAKAGAEVTITSRREVDAAFIESLQKRFGGTIRAVSDD